MSRSPLPPQAVHIGQAISGSEALARLGERLRGSQQRLEAACRVMPPALRSQVLAGPLDDEGWSLLARNAAVAAKLRHLLPAVEAALAEAGCPTVKVRVKVLATT